VIICKSNSARDEAAVAERGRKPKGNYKQKTKVFSARLRADTRAAIEKAAINSGHSLSQEIEHRLRRSFDEDQNLFEKLGGRENYAVLRLIASLMSVMLHPSDIITLSPAEPRKSWLHDPYLFDQLVRAIAVVLEELKPEGERDAPPVVPGGGGDVFDIIAPLQGRIRAAQLLSAVKNAPPKELPLNTKDPAPFLRDDLGQAADRIGNQKGRRFVRGTAEDFRRAADEMRREADNDEEKP
jgi:hypothetical protein